MNSKNNKQRLFEVMGKVNPTFKPKLNEYDNYNYPAGADADPNAPWHQTDDSLDYVDGHYSSVYPKSFEVVAHSADGVGTVSKEGFEMIDDYIYDNGEEIAPENRELINYFEQYRNGGFPADINNSKEFQENVGKLWDMVIGNDDFEWEYPDMEPPERDDFDEQKVVGEANHQEDMDPNYDPMDDFNRNPDPDIDLDFKGILGIIEKAFDTTTYGMGDDTYIPSKDSDLMLYDNKGMFTAYVNGEKVYEERTVNVDPQAVIAALKPHENLMLKGEEARNHAQSAYDGMFDDMAYAKQEKNAEYYGQRGLSGERDATDDEMDLWETKRSKKLLFEQMHKIAGLPLNENEELGVKFRAEVTGKGENRWSGNAMEYDTEEEAKEWLNNLANRWFGFDMSRVVPVTVPTGQQVDMENDVIYQNFRN